MKRSLIITLLSTVLCGFIFIAGSLLGSMFTQNASDATEAPTCTTLCPGSGSGGVIGHAATITIPSGGVGGSTAP